MLRELARSGTLQRNLKLAFRANLQHLDSGLAVGCKRAPDSIRAILAALPSASVVRDRFLVSFMASVIMVGLKMCARTMLQTLA